MNDKYLAEIMHAYAAGCLDHQDLIPLLETLDNEGELTNAELGELQNLTSLLPAILMIENPPASAKDSIAKKLYAIREEILIRRTLEREIPKEILQDNNTVEPEVSADTFADRESGTDQEQPVPEQDFPMDVTPEPDLSEQEIAQAETVPERKPRPKNNRDFTKRLRDKLVPEKPLFSKREPVLSTDYQSGRSTDNRKILTIMVVLFIILIIVSSSIVYYNLKGVIKDQQKILSSVQTEVSVLNDEIVRLNKIQRILAILGSKDVSTINLDGTIDNPTGFGKIVFDPVNREGLISFFNMPPLPRGKAFQLWLMSKGQPFSLGTYIPVKNGDRYIPLSEFPDIPVSNVDAFIVTLEDENGSDSPKGTVYLSSALKRSWRPAN